LLNAAKHIEGRLSGVGFFQKRSLKKQARGNRLQVTWETPQYPSQPNVPCLMSLAYDCFTR
jgi:hypothetical protein